MDTKRLIFATAVFAIGMLLILAEAASGEITRDGLVAEYHFENSTYDSSGNNNIGRADNVIYVDGRSGKALYFNGINSSVRVPDSMSLRPVSEISLEAWIKTEGKTTTWASVLSKMEQQQDSGYELYLLPRNTPRFGIISRVGGKTRLEGLNIPGDTWTHITATYDGSALILYINGEFDSFLERPRFVFPSKDDLWIGCWKNTDYFYGAIDEVRIYNRSLSAKEVKANYQAIVSPTHTSTPTSTPTLTPTPTYSLTQTSTLTETPTPTQTPAPKLTPIPTPRMIGFEAVLAIVGLLATSYLIRIGK